MPTCSKKSQSKSSKQKAVSGGGEAYVPPSTHLVVKTLSQPFLDHSISFSEGSDDCMLSKAFVSTFRIEKLRDLVP